MVIKPHLYWYARRCEKVIKCLYGGKALKPPRKVFMLQNNFSAAEHESLKSIRRSVFFMMDLESTF